MASSFDRTIQRRGCCTTMRTFLVRHMHGLTNGVDHEEWVTGPCNVPLFGDREGGVCRSCKEGWSHPNNYFADGARPAFERRWRRQHAAGPWHANCAADDRHNESCVSVRDPRGKIIATVNGGANARLIAAGPDLLDALEFAMRILDQDGVRPLLGTAFTETDLDMLQDAADKARGEGR